MVNVGITTTAFYGIMFWWRHACLYNLNIYTLLVRNANLRLEGNYLFR